MTKVKRAAQLASVAVVENRARQVALGFALAFASFILLTQFIRVFFG